MKISKKHSKPKAATASTFQQEVSKRINLLLEFLIADTAMDSNLDKLLALFEEADMQLITRDRRLLLGIKASTLQYLIGSDKLLEYMNLYRLNTLVLQVTRDYSNVQLTLAQVGNDWIKLMLDCYRDGTPALRRDRLRLHLDYNRGISQQKKQEQANTYKDYLLYFNAGLAEDAYIKYSSSKAEPVLRPLWDNFAEVLGASEDAEVLVEDSK